MLKSIFNAVWGLFFALLFVPSQCLAEVYHFVSIERLIEQEVGRIIVPEIYKKLGVRVTITPLPGSRAQREAASGRKDGEIMRIWAYGHETPSAVRVPTPYYYLETMAFFRKDREVVIRGREDLRRYRVARIRGVKHTENITAGMPHVYDLRSTEQMMKFLRIGRADVGLTNTLDGRIALRKLRIAGIMSRAEPLAVLDLYHYIHEKHKHLVPRVDAVIREMKASGELDVLIKGAEKRVIDRLLRG